MYIICIESSKKRGMGHLFRALLYASYLDGVGKDYIVLVNNDIESINILENRNIPFRVVDFDDNSDWESQIIKEYEATIWLEDKYETSIKMAQNIKKNDILLCAIDEFGDGAEFCDLHFAGMIYLTGHEIKGRKLYCGTEYVILNKQIDCFKRIRTELNNVIVTLGGSDPHGNTVDIVRELSKTDINVGVVVGPDFGYKNELKKVNSKHYPILQNLPSLIAEFSKYDFAITGGGVTCCEANSCGLPCLIIANAPHEVYTGKFMEKKGGAIFAGSYDGWDKSLISKLHSLDIEKMSKKGMECFDTKALERIFSLIEKEKCNYER